MSDNHSAFVGSIPQNYDRYLGPIIFEDYAIDLAKRIANFENAHVLEVAAGTGILTQRLCELLPTTSNIVVTDLNQDMLSFAQEKLRDKNNLTFRCTDAANIPFPDNTFNIVTVQFSIMFFPDKVAALKEWSRVLKPQGKVVTNIWDSIPENHLIKTITESLTEFFPDGLPKFFEIPYGWYDTELIEKTFRDARYDSFEIVTSRRESQCESARQVALGYLTGTPFSLVLARHTGITLETVLDHIEDAVKSKYGDPPRDAMMQAIEVVAQPNL